MNQSQRDRVNELLAETESTEKPHASSGSGETQVSYILPESFEYSPLGIMYVCSGS